MTKFLHDELWPRLHALSKQAAPGYVAVAYLSPSMSAGTSSTGITGDQGPTRWRGNGSPPAPMRVEERRVVPPFLNWRQPR